MAEVFIPTIYPDIILIVIPGLKLKDNIFNNINGVELHATAGYRLSSPGYQEGPLVRNHAATSKKSTSVSLAESLLAEAKALGINVSQAAEEGLARAVSAKRSEAWIRENQDAIQGYNRFVEEHGLILEKYRTF